MKAICFPMFLFALFSVAAAQTPQTSSIDDLTPLIGEWRGEARQFQPRDKEAEELTETVSGTCRPILDGYYIECATHWVRSDGRERAHHSFANYDAAKGIFENLFIFLGWPAKISYPFKWDEEKTMFIGFHDDETRDGRPVKVRVEFGFSTDGREHWAREFSNIEGEPSDYWPQTFEMTWTRQ